MAARREHFANSTFEMGGGSKEEETRWMEAVEAGPEKWENFLDFFLPIFHPHPTPPHP